MSRILVVGMATALFGCDAPFWEKHKREDAAIARQEAVRAKEHETWDAEETRRLLALCLDIAKFEKQWNNFAEWSFNRLTGGCTVSYKKPAADKKTAKQCADEWLREKGERAGDEPSATAPEWKQTMYFTCTSETFSKTWNVRAATKRSE